MKRHGDYSTKFIITLSSAKFKLKKNSQAQEMEKKNKIIVKIHRRAFGAWFAFW
jgi:hypothetical protein